MHDMRIAAIKQHGVAGWPTLKWAPITPGLNAVCGPSRSGKSMLADLLARTLFGRSAAPASVTVAAPTVPGEVFIESDLGRHRVRLYYDEQRMPRLTIAATDGSAAGAGTIRQLVGGLSPAVLGPLCAVGFREPPPVAALLSEEFTRGFLAIDGAMSQLNGRRTAELITRRDVLAQELESRIAGDRRASKDLEARRRELDRLLRREQEQLAAVEQSLRAAETALVETDARLRYRRLEVRLEEQPALANAESSAAPDDAEHHIARVRAMLADLAHREAAVRAQLAQVHADSLGGDPRPDTQAWLAVARQLAADLAGEVARLARAAASQQCVCRDAHPRLRPISETIERQLDALQKLLDDQQRSAAAGELQTEAGHLAQSQIELRRHLERLLERLQSPTRQTARPASSPFSAADAEQLESRRLELEQQRLQLLEQLRTRTSQIRDLRAQRETAERERAALLSARSIEHVQRELASVQQKLQHAASSGGNAGEACFADDCLAKASDFLAQLSDGGLVRLWLVEQGRRACVVNRAGQTLRVESLAPAERDHVYLALCLALHSAAAEHGLRLPLVLDEPFQRLEPRQAAALAAVLDDFCRQGHQVLVFTAQQAAAERLAAVGAAVRDSGTLRQRPVLNEAPAPSPQQAAHSIPAARQSRKHKRRRPAARRQRDTPAPPSLDDSQCNGDRSDAA
jgi:energy-coupling factor transporter ATP-binding protein EcfA2